MSWWVQYHPFPQVCAGISLRVRQTLLLLSEFASFPMACCPALSHDSSGDRVTLPLVWNSRKWSEIFMVNELWKQASNINAIKVFSNGILPCPISWFIWGHESHFQWYEIQAKKKKIRNMVSKLWKQTSNVNAITVIKIKLWEFTGVN